MRPRERLLRRGIPNDANSIRVALERWSDRLSSWENFFTAVVVLGLIVEYLPAITSFLGAYVSGLVKPHAQPLLELGGLLVIIGVTGELWIGHRSGRVETDLRDETNKLISDSDERIAELNKRALEAELRLAELDKPRKITDEQMEELKRFLVRYAGLRVDICLYDGFRFEASLFAARLHELFNAAGLMARIWPCDGERMPGPGLVLAVSANEFVEQGAIGELQYLAIEFANRMHGLEIDCASLAKGFDPTRRPADRPGSYRMDDIAPFRIQVGEKQIPLRRQL